MNYPAQSADRAIPPRLLEYVQLARSVAMSDMQISTSMTMRISEAARDNIAAGIWFAVVVGWLWLSVLSLRLKPD